MAIENVFSWSKSRDEEFRECQRKYFYDRYASWGGWDRTAPKEARLAYILKNLKNRWAWKGETVHHVIESVLKAARSGQPLALEQALDQLTHTMRKDFRSSKGKKYYDEPKKSIGLFEHEYEKPVSDDIWKRVHDESAACVRGFYQSGFFKELLADDKKSWLVIEDLEEYDFEGAKVFVKLDFARNKNGVIEIYDWKTGKSDSAGAGVQIGAYAIFAMKKWGVPVEAVQAYLFYLSEDLPRPESQPVTKELIESTKKTMTQSIAEMHKLLLDPVKNIPKPRENFPYTENTRLCDFCNFYKMCEKYNSSK